MHGKPNVLLQWLTSRFTTEVQMKTSKLAGLAVFILLALAACNMPFRSTTVPVATAASLPASTRTSESLPFEGVWVSDGSTPEVIVFSKDSMYRMQSAQASESESYSREQFADVVSYDTVNNHISLRTQWIRVNGAMSGFDAPNFNITYKVNGDTLQIGVGWDTEFTTDVDPLVYHRK
jgi:hypothetical protein